jgi:hypothetical protein
MKQPVEGIKTEHINVLLSTQALTRFNYEFHSNEIDESAENEKLVEQRISTLRGVTID